MLPALIPTAGKVILGLAGAGVAVHKANCAVEIAEIAARKEMFIAGVAVGGVCYVANKLFDVFKNCKEGEFNFQCADMCANAKVKN